MEQTFSGSASDRGRLSHGRRAGPGRGRSRRLRLWGTCGDVDIDQIERGSRQGDGADVEPESARRPKRPSLIDQGDAKPVSAEGQRCCGADESGAHHGDIVDVGVR